MWLRLLTGQNPVDALSGVSLELQEDFGGGKVETQFVPRELCLSDAEYPPELGLGEIKAPDLPDAAPDCLQIEIRVFDLAEAMHYSAIICV